MVFSKFDLFRARFTTEAILNYMLMIANKVLSTYS